MTPSLRHLLCLSPLLVSGCVVGPDYVEPATEVPAQFGSQPSGATESSVDGQWWRRFKDPQLDSLIAQAEARNRDLKVAAARLSEARALWRSARLELIPRINTTGGYTSIQNSNAGPFMNEAQHYDLYDVGLDATWELDLFGRVRQAMRAAKASQEGVEAEHDALLIALRAEVAANYLMLRGAQAQLDVAESNSENQAESLRIAEASLEGGRGNQLDVARAKAQWNATRASVPQLQASIDGSAHRIAVLCGQAPSALRDSLRKPKALPATPAKVVVLKPAEVLRQRPDIRVAERQLASSTAQIGVVTADLFPRVTFNGSIGLEAGELHRLGSTGSSVHNFGPRLSWAALDLGRVRQQIKAADARAEASLANYEQTVLLALEEAETALSAYDREILRLRFLRESAKAAEEAVKLARQRYKDGVSDFLETLDAERVALAAQNDVVLSQTKAAVAWVTVYKAMGGGWNTGPAAWSAGK